MNKHQTATGTGSIALGPQAVAIGIESMTCQPSDTPRTDRTRYSAQATLTEAQNMERELNVALARVKELEEALSCVMPRCEHLHHDWKYRHKAAERCPVVDLVNKAKEKP